MNVSKTEIANALAILLAAVNEQPMVDIAKHKYATGEAQHALDTMVGITSSTIYCADEVAAKMALIAETESSLSMDIGEVTTRFYLFNRMMEKHDIELEDIESMIVKVKSLERKHGDLDEIEEVMENSQEALTWWEEHADTAEDMLYCYQTCTKYDLDTDDIRKIGDALRIGDADDMVEAFNVLEVMDGIDADDAAEIMEFLAEKEMNIEELKEMCESKEAKSLLIEKYKAIEAIVNGD